MPALRAVALLLVVLAALGPRPALAGDDDLVIEGLTQDQFRDLSRDLGLAISAFQVAPAESLGMRLTVPHVDAGLEVTALDIDDDRDYWRRAIRDGSPPSFLVVPKLHVNIGLPLGLELGGLYGDVADSNIRLWGGEVKWAVIRGGAVWPAVALRGAHTELAGVDELDLTSTSIDLSASKGLGPVTPYLGIGRVWVEAEPQGAAAEPPAGLGEVRPTDDRLFAGARLRLGLLTVVAEGSWSRVPTYSVRLSLSF
ncbi:MAG TPA: hypothetical protein VF406_21155 [Thermodesulfobacteriota bacterium]